MANALLIDLRRFERYMSDVILNQLPFSASNALNTTAFGAQSIIRKEMPKKFTVRKSYIIRGVVVKKSSKRDLVAFVQDKDDFMYKQERGGIHKAKVRNLAVPEEIRTNPRRSIPKAKRPREITKKPKVFVTKYSIVQRKGGKKIRRKSSAGSFKAKYKILYRLRPSVRLKPRFEFGDTVEYAVNKIFHGAFNAALRRALATAK